MVQPGADEPVAAVDTLARRRKRRFHRTANLDRLVAGVDLDIAPAQHGAVGDVGLQLHLVRQADRQRARLQAGWQPASACPRPCSRPRRRASRRRAGRAWRPRRRRRGNRAAARSARRAARPRGPRCPAPGRSGGRACTSRHSGPWHRSAARIAGSSRRHSRSALPARHRRPSAGRGTPAGRRAPATRPPPTMPACSSTPPLVARPQHMRQVVDAAGRKQQAVRPARRGRQALAIAAISIADLVPSRNELNICGFMPAALRLARRQAVVAPRRRPASRRDRPAGTWCPCRRRRRGSRSRAPSPPSRRSAPAGRRRPCE